MLQKLAAMRYVIFLILIVMLSFELGFSAESSAMERKIAECRQYMSTLNHHQLVEELSKAIGKINDPDNMMRFGIAREEILKRSGAGLVLINRIKDKDLSPHQRILILNGIVSDLPAVEKDEAVIHELIKIAADTSDDKTVRINAIGAMLGCQPRAEKKVVALLSQLIRTENDSLILEKAFGYIGYFNDIDSSVKDFLFNKAESNDTNTRLGALLALANIGKKDRDPRIEEVLIRNLSHPSKEIKSQTIQYVGILGTSKAVGILANIYRDQNNTDLIRSWAIEAIVKVASHGNEQAFDIAIESLNDSDPVVAWAAGRAMMKMGIKRSIPYLKKTLEKNHDPLIQQNFERYIGELSK